MESKFTKPSQEPEAHWTSSLSFLMDHIPFLCLSNLFPFSQTPTTFYKAQCDHQPRGSLTRCSGAATTEVSVGGLGAPGCSTQPSWPWLLLPGQASAPAHRWNLGRGVVCCYNRAAGVVTGNPRRDVSRDLITSIWETYERC